MSAQTRRLTLSAFFFIGSIGVLTLASKASANIPPDGCNGKGLLCEKIESCGTSGGTTTCQTKYYYYAE